MDVNTEKEGCLKCRHTKQQLLADDDEIPF